MKADPTVVEWLNVQLTNELTAINQYFLHARMLDKWGVTKLAKYEHGESIEETKHADELIKRILFLDGLPNVQRLNRILIGQTVEEVLRCDMKLEEEATADLREAIAHCKNARDFMSRDLFLEILANEEEHVDFLETQFHMIETLELERYIHLNSGAAPEQHGA